MYCQNAPLKIFFFFQIYPSLIWLQIPRVMGKSKLLVSLFLLTVFSYLVLYGYFSLQLHTKLLFLNHYQILRASLHDFAICILYLDGYWLLPFNMLYGLNNNHLYSHSNLETKLIKHRLVEFYFLSKLS